MTIHPRNESLNQSFLNTFPYEVKISDRYDSIPPDTLLQANATTVHEGGFASSLMADSTDSVTFYYIRANIGNLSTNVSDPLPWSVDSTGRYFTGPYGLAANGDSLFFTKNYQPVDISLWDSNSLQYIKYPCHWDHNTGKLLLTSAMSPSASHSGTIAFKFDYNEGPHNTAPAVHINLSDYRYHTYSLEILPHEVRFLIDGHVLRRSPDRLIPPGDLEAGYPEIAPRSPMNIVPAEFGPASTDSAYNSYFKAHVSTCQGCWPINGQPAAHQMIDYVKVFDLPKDVIVPPFPK